MLALKKYQENAINKLIKVSTKQLSKNKTNPIVLESPTGSGKTIIAINYIERLTNIVNYDLCFLWISIGKGELHKQSLITVKQEISNDFKCNLLEEEYFGTKNYIDQNEIVFISWQKIKLKDNLTGNWKALVMKEKETINFIEVLKNTRNQNRKIVLIIDESHTSAKTEKSLELINNIIKPNLIIEMSATPIINGNSTKITIDSNDVIESGMIKKEIIINKDIDKITASDLDSQQLIILSAINKQKELKKLYKQENTNINPLVLIQLPNSNVGNNIKENIEQILKDNNISEENKKLAIWLNDEKINNEYQNLRKNNSKVEYLIFKQAIDTGWDCPRAQILIKFRETKSIIFEIQTLGRILRMPEAKHYNNDVLNTAYVYTNINNIIVKKETYNPNIIKSCKSAIKKDYKPIYLLSYYKKREELSIIQSIYTPILTRTFARFFLIDEDKKRQNYKLNNENFMKSGINKEFNHLDTIYQNVELSTKSLDKNNKNIITSSKLKVDMNNTDLQYAFEKIIINNLNGFSQSFSLPIVKSAIMYAMKKYLNLNLSNNGLIYIEKLIVNNKEIFERIINESIKDYKTLYNNKLSNQDKWIDNWQIEDTRNYNPNSYTELKSKLSLHQPLYVEIQENGKINEDELAFIKYLDKQEKYIDWFWLNGQEHMQKNFAIKTNNNKSFQPNFIIKFKNGKIGIFDIKKNKSINSATKAQSIYNYIKEQNKNLIGGLIYKDNNNFRVFTRYNYVDFIKEPSKWEYFENLYK